jgi:LysR family hydrogen peroxide-inducible transcriptional activator
MNLRDLEYLLALADAGHFGRAAAQCRVTQPTLSMQVAKVENDLGVRLFERGPRHVVPTAAGRKVLAQARVVLDEVRRLRGLAHAPGDPLAGGFRLGVIPTACPYLLPHLLPTLKDRHPRMELFLREEVTGRLLDRLHAADLDAAILSLPLADPSLVVETLLEEAFVAALPPGDPLSRAKYVREEDLAARPLLFLEEGHCMREQTLRLCGRPRQSGHVPFQAGSIESLRQMVSAGIGCTLLPALAAEGPFAAATPLVLKPFAPPAPTRTLVLAWRRSFPQGPTLHALARAVRDTFPGPAGGPPPGPARKGRVNKRPRRG